MSKTAILLAEDEPSLGQIISESLESRGFEVTHCLDGESAYKTYVEMKPNLLILDVMMPKKDGFALAQEIRETDETTPIIFLTAKSQTKDVIEGFHRGGNDYLKKPFSMEELIVRIEQLLYRFSVKKETPIMLLSQFSFDVKKQTLQYQFEEPQHLTHREAQLLFHLCKNKNEVLDRSVILNKLWNNDDFFSARSMDVFISKLRKKLQKDPQIQIINVRGFGYKLVY